MWKDFGSVDLCNGLICVMEWIKLWRERERERERVGFGKEEENGSGRGKKSPGIAFE